MSISFTLRGDTAYVAGAIGPSVRELMSNLPDGARVRANGTYAFPATRGNVTHLRTAAPNAVWHGFARVFAEIERAERLERQPAPVDTTPLRFDWKTPPYHAAQGRAFAFARHRPYFGLFMEQGTGKTWVAINTAASKWSAGEIDAVVVVAPNGVHRQWADEQIPAHMPDWVNRKVYAHRAGKTPPAWVTSSRDDNSDLTVLCINCEALAHQSGKDLLMKFMTGRRVFLVVDESIRFKSPRAARTKTLLRLASDMACTAILSGAPVTKGVEDLYSQFALLSTSILGQSSYRTFLARYCTLQPAYRGAPPGATKIVGYRNLDELTGRVAAHTFRVTKAECLDLPPKIYMTRYVTQTPEQRRIYNDLRTALLTEINGGRISAPNAAVRLMRLQQVLCGHLPVVNDAGEIERIEPVPSNRVEATMDILEEDEAPTIIWARFRHDISALRDALTAAGITFVTYFGDTKESERADNIRKFMSGEARVFLANPAAAGTGLNLQRASRMIYYSNSFNADYRWQSEDRAHRIGQTNPVTIIDLVVPGTIDTQIVKALRARQDIARMVLDDPRAVLAADNELELAA